LIAFISAFLKSLAVAGKSEQTRLNYERDLMQFSAFALNIDPDMAWQDIRHVMVQEFVMSRVQGGISGSTVKRQVSALRSFYRYLIREGIVTSNPASDVKTPKQPKPLPKSVNVDMTTQLLETDSQGWAELRDQAMFELLYSAGLRVSELVALDLSPGCDDLASGWVRVLGKGQKERQAPVGRMALTALSRWLRVRNEIAQSDEKALFVNRYGQRLSVRGVQQRLDKRAQKTGVPTKMSPHRLRHACATHVLESSSDLRAVQEMLGHANLSTTQIYTKLDMQHLAKVYDAAHPRAKK